MKIPLLMTPGPTYVHEEVRSAMAREITNPDLDPDFYEFYKETSDALKALMKTRNDILILSGEGILGLEAACCSVIEPGDRILCIDNGIFGKGFGDFASMYGGEVTYFTDKYRHAIDVDKLKSFLEKDSSFKAATLVHCETPSGITNPVKDICILLKQYGILSIVDSVSAIGGEELSVDEWGMDIVLGGSQKCLSAPPGLTFLSVSHDAWKKILGRKAPITGFYCNLSHWKNWYQDKWFPYTQPISDIYALKAAVDRLTKDKSYISRHRIAAEAVRNSIRAAGLELYPLSGFSNTVSTIMVPEGIKFSEINNIMLSEHNVMIAGAFDFLKDKVMRIGHMGENCSINKIKAALDALDDTLAKLKHRTNAKMSEVFAKSLV
ncbi:MAG: alanine--glyoxylate aminotransferase family protein [Clostridia bacterium]|nr:alanine--glyoxylate aminotransferase family protein [Clostridia bacterium]